MLLLGGVRLVWKGSAGKGSPVRRLREYFARVLCDVVVGRGHFVCRVRRSRPSACRPQNTRLSKGVGWGRLLNNLRIAPGTQELPDLCRQGPSVGCSCCQAQHRSDKASDLAACYATPPVCAGRNYACGSALAWACISTRMLTRALTTVRRVHPHSMVKHTLRLSSSYVVGNRVELCFCIL